MSEICTISMGEKVTITLAPTQNGAQAYEITNSTGQKVTIAPCPLEPTQRERRLEQALCKILRILNYDSAGEVVTIKMAQQRFSAIASTAFEALDEIGR